MNNLKNSHSSSICFTPTNESMMFGCTVLINQSIKISVLISASPLDASVRLSSTLQYSVPGADHYFIIYTQQFFEFPKEPDSKNPTTSTTINTPLV